MAIEVPQRMGASTLHRISPDEYRRLVQSGVFDEDARIELIDGLLVDMSPKTPKHENAIAWLTRLLFGAVDLDRFEIRVGAPLTIDNSEPEPDLIVIPRAAPRPRHPATAALVIEVSVSSLAHDLRTKPAIYALAAVPRYWVIDLDGDCAFAHSAPGDGGYATIEAIARDGALAAPELGVRVAVSELLAASGG